MMTTGMQDGIAIPHGKTDTVDELMIAIGLKPDGVNFDSMDEKPSTIFRMTLFPENQAGSHIQFLAEISKVLRDKNIREKLLSTNSADEIFKILTT